MDLVVVLEFPAVRGEDRGAVEAATVGRPDRMADLDEGIGPSRDLGGPFDARSTLVAEIGDRVEIETEPGLAEFREQQKSGLVGLRVPIR